MHPPDEINEAADAFKRAHHKHIKSFHRKEFGTACESLRKSVLQAARDAYLVVQEEPGGDALIGLRRAAVRLSIGEDDLGLYLCDAEDRTVELAVEYDPATKSFVGTEVVPGHPPRRRNAVVVVAEAIIGELDKRLSPPTP